MARPDTPGTYQIKYDEYTGTVTETVRVYRRPSGKLAVLHGDEDQLLSNFRRKEKITWELS